MICSSANLLRSGAIMIIGGDWANRGCSGILVSARLEIRAQVIGQWRFGDDRRRAVVEGNGNSPRDQVQRHRCVLARGAIDRIAENRRAEGSAVHADLMGAAGPG